MERIIVLGANGFVGRSVVEGLQSCTRNVTALSRKDLEIGNHNDYKKHDFNFATIIDCIARIDGTPEEVFENNFQDFSNFIDYLSSNAKGIRYVYFSTLSTNYQSLVDANAYVRSKYLAEQILLSKIKSCQIIKLSFPFGFGESANRLVSRLIKRIRAGEELVIDDIELSLIPVGQLRNDICKILKFDDRIIQYVNAHYVTLVEVVDILFEKMGKPKKYKVVKNNSVSIKPSAEFPIFQTSVNPFIEIENLLMADNAL